MPPPIGRRRVEEFARAFGREVDSLAALYRRAAADMMRVLSDASASLFARQRALAHLRQYQVILAGLRDEAAAWIELNIPRAYGVGLEFADEGVREIRKAGVNLGRRQREVFSQVHREAVAAIAEEMLRTTDFALAQIGRRVDDVFRRVGVTTVAEGVVAGRARVGVSREIERRLLAEGAPVFVDRLGREWRLDRYAEMVARTTTREAMTQGTINRLREHNIQLAQVSAHNATDFCIYYENAIVSIGEEPHPVYPPITAIQGGPPFHPNCVHVLTPFVERLATPEELERGKIDPDLLNRSPAELQRRYRKEFPAQARAAGRQAMRAARAAPTPKPQPPPAPPWEKVMQPPGPMTRMEIDFVLGETQRMMAEGAPAFGGGVAHELEDVLPGELKDQIVRALAARLESNEAFRATAHRLAPRVEGRYGEPLLDMIDKLIKQWAYTSGDDNALSVAMQMAAAEEFEIKMPAMWWRASAKANARNFYLADPQFRAGLRAFARAMYDHTQEWLAERGIDYVVVLRGVAFDSPEQGAGLTWSARGAPLRQNARIRMQPMSSFSASHNTAYDFAMMQQGDYKALIMARIPRERVVATARTGYGCITETEWVVLGGEPAANEVAAVTWAHSAGGRGSNMLLDQLIGAAGE